MTRQRSHQPDCKRNIQSDAVKQIEPNYYIGRYAEGHPNTAQQDKGTRYIDQIESMTSR